MNVEKIKKIQIFFLTVAFVTVIFFFILNLFFTKSIARTSLWKERLMSIFYFTIWSNILVIILFGLKIFKKDLINKKSFILFEFITLTSITLTMLGYWIILASYVFPLYFKNNLYLNMIIDICLHFLVPFFALTNFFYERIKTNHFKKVNEKIFIYSLKLMSFFIIWLACAFVIYFALGHHSEDAIYFFLDFINSGSGSRESSLGLKIFLLFFIIISYYSISVSFVFMNNHFAKKQKNL